MIKLAEIQEAIRALPQEDQQVLLAWLQESDAGEDAVFRAALQRKEDSLSGLGTSRPYREAIASAQSLLAKPHDRRPAPGS